MRMNLNERHHISTKLITFLADVEILAPVSAAPKPPNSVRFWEWDCLAKEPKPLTMSDQIQ